MHNKHLFLLLLIIIPSNHAYGESSEDIIKKIATLMTQKEVIKESCSECTELENKTTFENSINPDALSTAWPSFGILSFRQEINKLPEVQKYERLLKAEKKLLKLKQKLLNAYEQENDNRFPTLSDGAKCCASALGVSLAWYLHNTYYFRDGAHTTTFHSQQPLMRELYGPLTAITLLDSIYITLKLYPNSEKATQDLEDDILTTQKRIVKLANRITTKYPQLSCYVPVEAILKGKEPAITSI